MAETVERRHDNKVYSVAVAEAPVLRCDACQEVIYTLETEEAIETALCRLIKIPTPKEIAELRHSAGLTQPQTSSDTGIAVATISKYENGRQLPSDATAQHLVVYYRDPVYYRQLLSCDWVTTPPAKARRSISVKKRVLKKRPAFAMFSFAEAPFSGTWVDLVPQQPAKPASVSKSPDASILCADPQNYALAA